jgi:hypothetical protein
MFGFIFGFIAASPDDHRLPVEASGGGSSRSIPLRDLRGRLGN